MLTFAHCQDPELCSKIYQKLRILLGRLYLCAAPPPDGFDLSAPRLSWRSLVASDKEEGRHQAKFEDKVKARLVEMDKALETTTTGGQEESEQEKKQDWLQFLSTGGYMYGGVRTLSCVEAASTSYLERNSAGGGGQLPQSQRGKRSCSALARPTLTFLSCCRSVPVSVPYYYSQVRIVCRKRRKILMSTRRFEVRKLQSDECGGDGGIIPRSSPCRYHHHCRPARPFNSSHIIVMIPYVLHSAL